jgi:hypothetical protein
MKSGAYGNNAKSWNPKSEKIQSRALIIHWSNTGVWTLEVAGVWPGNPLGSDGTLSTTEVIGSLRTKSWASDFIFGSQALINSFRSVEAWGMSTPIKLEKTDLRTGNTSLCNDHQCVCHEDWNTWPIGLAAFPSKFAQIMMIRMQSWDLHCTGYSALPQEHTVT